MMFMKIPFIWRDGSYGYEEHDDNDDAVDGHDEHVDHYLQIFWLNLE